MNIMHKITLKGLKKNKTRTVVTIIGVVLSLAMITAVTTLGSSVQNYLKNSAILSNGDWHARIETSNLDDFENIINDDRFKELAIVKGGGYAPLKDGINEYKPYLYIMELDKNAYETLPIHLTEGRLAETPNELVLSNHISSNGGVKYELGDIINLEIGKRTIDGNALNQSNPFHHEDNEEAEEFHSTSSRTFTVVGFCERFPYEIEGFSAAGYSILTTFDESQPITESDSDISIYVKLKNPRKVFDLEQEYLNQYKINNFEYNSTYLHYEGASNISSFNIVLYGLATIIIALIMIGSIALIYNSFSISISERKRQFGLLSSVGATRKQLVNSVFFEAFFISLFGIPIGIGSGIIGIGITLHFLKDTFASMLGNTTIELTLNVSIPSIIAAIILGLITVLISAYIPARHSKKISALDAIRQTADIKTNPKNVKTSRLTRKIFAIEGDFALKNLKRNKKKYRSTVLSLFISVLLFISASAVSMYLTDTVGNVFQTPNYDIEYNAFQEGLNTNHVKNVYKDIMNLDNVYDSSIINTGFAMTYFNKEQVETSHYYRLLENGMINDGDDVRVELEIYAIDHDSFLKYLDNINYKKEKFLNTDKVNAIVIDKQHFFDFEEERYINSNILKEHSETMITIQENHYDSDSDNDDDKIEIPVVLGGFAETSPLGITEYSYENRITLIFDAETVQSFPNQPTSNNIRDLSWHEGSSMYFKSKNPTEDEGKIKKILLEASMDTDNLFNQHKEMQTINNLILIIKVFAYGFITLMALITTANVFNTITTNINLRRREFAMLKSVGMTNLGFKKMLNYECIFYGLKALLYGIPTSIFVTYLIYLTFKHGVETSFYLPVSSILISILTVFFIVFISMIYSMRKVNKENILDALKNENL